MQRQRPVDWIEVRGLLRRGPREYLIVNLAGGSASVWLFPGGRVTTGLADEESLRRWCLTNLGLELGTLTPVEAFDYGHGNHTISYRWLYGEVGDDDALPLGCVGLRWLTPKELNEITLDGPSAVIAARLGSVGFVR